jgi:hypothetical protein
MIAHGKCLYNHNSKKFILSGRVTFSKLTSHAILLQFEQSWYRVMQRAMRELCLQSYFLDVVQKFLIYYFIAEKDTS